MRQVFHAEALEDLLPRTVLLRHLPNRRRVPLGHDVDEEREELLYDPVDLVNPIVVRLVTDARKYGERDTHP